MRVHSCPWVLLAERARHITRCIKVRHMLDISQRKTASTGMDITKPLSLTTARHRVIRRLWRPPMQAWPVYVLRMSLCSETIYTQLFRKPASRRKWHWPSYHSFLFQRIVVELFKSITGPIISSHYLVVSAGVSMYPGMGPSPIADEFLPLLLKIWQYDTGEETKLSSCRTTTSHHNQD